MGFATLYPSYRAHRYSQVFLSTSSRQGLPGSRSHGWRHQNTNITMWIVHIPVLWIPAIPAGMTVSRKHLCIKMRSGAWETHVNAVIIISFPRQERRRFASATDLIPYAAPSTGAFGGNSPLGGRQGCRTLTKGQEPLSSTLVESEDRRIKAAIGSPFLWILSFGEAKESISPSGAITRLNQSSR